MPELIESPEHAARILGSYNWPWWGWPHEYAPMHGQGVTVAYIPETKLIGGVFQPVLRWQVSSYLILPQGEYVDPDAEEMDCFAYTPIDIWTPEELAEADAEAKRLFEFLNPGEKWLEPPGAD